MICPIEEGFIEINGGPSVLPLIYGLLSSISLCIFWFLRFTVDFSTVLGVRSHCIFESPTLRFSRVTLWPTKGDLYLAGNLILLSFREKFEFRTHYLSFLEHEELLSFRWEVWWNSEAKFRASQKRASCFRKKSKSVKYFYFHFLTLNLKLKLKVEGGGSPSWRLIQSLMGNCLYGLWLALKTFIPEALTCSTVPWGPYGLYGSLR